MTIYMYFPFLASESSTVSGVSSASSTVKRDAKGEGSNGQTGPPALGPDGQPLENEDTMKNLRKTFAGIFGDIN